MLKDAEGASGKSKRESSCSRSSSSAPPMLMEKSTPGLRTADAMSRASASLPSASAEGVMVFSSAEDCCDCETSDERMKRHAILFSCRMISSFGVQAAVQPPMSTMSCSWRLVHTQWLKKNLKSDAGRAPLPTNSCACDTPPTKSPFPIGRDPWIPSCSCIMITALLPASPPVYSLLPPSGVPSRAGAISPSSKAVTWSTMTPLAIGSVSSAKLSHS
mmetsp:Transcript_9617/g.36046  ORF Transcript_9617/g.36046 Transcript_9617/m.36046 type:complete len:217 (-) Transcript_9617:270-920(-)